MTNIRAIALLGCLALGLAACSSNVSSTATNATTVSPPGSTTASTLAATSAVTPPASTVETTGATTTASTASATTTTTASSSTSTPASPSTSPKTAPKTAPKTPAPTSPAGPVFASFSANVDPCPTTVAPGVSFTPPPDTGMITVTWKVTGAYDMIYDALDNVDGPFTQGLPASGSASFGRICDGHTHTVYVVAVYKGHKVVKSKSYSGS